MLKWGGLLLAFVAVMSRLDVPAHGQEATGSIRGVVYDRDFDAPLAGARITVVELGRSETTSDQGNYVIHDLPGGTYTLTFSRPGYVREVQGDVVVSPGRITEADARLSGDFTEMEEFVVQDVLRIGAGTEAALLQLRLESPALLDSVSAELMSQAGASDAASALKLVAGASVQEGKFAVIRGLPDRYVSSQLNGVRLPTADEETRAVELDQFPAAVIESIQVSKTFTPDQQGDASGGAVNVRLEGIPDETIFQIKAQLGYDTQVRFRDDFLTYEGGGVDFLGDDDREIQPLGTNWDGAVGVSRDDAPIQYKWSASAGGKEVLDDGVEIGGFASVFYERDSSFHDDGIDDAYWVESPGGGLTPQKKQEDGFDEFFTALFDVTEAKELVQWGGLGALGVETEDHFLGLTFLYSRTAEDKATLAEDTRGKQFFFPTYDPNDSTHPGNSNANQQIAPYIRTQTLEYTERETSSLQLGGRHTLAFQPFGVRDLVEFGEPELEWTAASSRAGLNQPDKRQFGSFWLGPSFKPAQPPFMPNPTTDPAEYFPFKPAANINFGNLQRIFKTIEEDSQQYFVDLKLPFEQWEEHEGYVKLGLFDDRVVRKYREDTFDNDLTQASDKSYVGDFDEPWSDAFPGQFQPIKASEFDVDYDGEQEISAVYAMVDLPLTSKLSVITGARLESTEIRTVVDPDQDAIFYDATPGNAANVINLSNNPGAANADFEQNDVLPALTLVYEATESLTLRASYSQTVARQTFRELTPVIQQEFLGGPIFIGNPDLEMGALENYDLRADYSPVEGSLVSLSWFTKDLEDPIEFVQTEGQKFTFTTAVNYPDGRLSGWEIELRQALDRYWEPLRGLTVGGNATFIDSEVSLPASEIAALQDPGVQAPIFERDATNAPEHLYNLFITYDIAPLRTRAGLFYTVKGDTLVAGATVAEGNFVPSVYEKEVGTLNFTLSRDIGDHLSIKFQAKNLTDPEIEEVFRSDFTGGDVTKTSFTRGREFSIGLTVSL